METPENNFEVLWVTISHNQCNIIVGVIYHPPKSIYKEIELLTYLETCLSIFNKKFSSSIVIHAGDFNSLKNEDIVEHTALLEFVQNPYNGAPKIAVNKSRQVVEYRPRKPAQIATFREK